MFASDWQLLQAFLLKTFHMKHLKSYMPNYAKNPWMKLGYGLEWLARYAGTEKYKIGNVRNTVTKNRRNATKIRREIAGGVGMVGRDGQVLPALPTSPTCLLLLLLLPCNPQVVLS